MTGPAITAADERNWSINDGYTRYEFELDPYSRRVTVTGGEFYNREFEPQLGGSFSLEAIDNLADALKAMVERVRGAV